jgi:hypothetical protein
MILISNRIKDLVIGYDLISNTDAELKRKLRQPLLQTYARRRQGYEAVLQQMRRRQEWFRSRMLLGLAFASLLILFGALMCPLAIYLEGLPELRLALFCFSPLIFFIGLIGLGILLLMWLWQRNPEQKQPPPPHPIQTSLVAPLLPHWRDGMRGSLPDEQAYQGAPGEYEFINRLLRLEDEAYLAYRLQQRPGDDVDVITVGPKGVWVFEVKYMSGEITYQEGKWSRQKSYYLPGGKQVTEQRKFNEPPDQQWHRMVRDVAETLRRQVPDLVARLPQVTKIRGGLVFTHPEAAYNIPTESSINWGTIPFWIKKYNLAFEIPGMDERSALQILEALLARHRQVSGEKTIRSMASYARRLIEKAEILVRESYIDE